MSRGLIERRLTEVHRRLQRAREELAVIDEQLAALVEAADDTRLRAIVSETPIAEVEHRDAQRHADAMARSRATVLESIAQLEKAQDELLDRLEVG
jgi:demethoxyubiquinone hydroxylase (CLK1/Coq7/Cat5 family)